MSTYIKKVLAAPLFPDDEDKMRAASLLNVLLWGFMLTLLLIALGGAIGGFYLYRPDRHVLDMIVTLGVDPSLVRDALGPGEGLAGKILLTGELLVVEDYMRWEGRADIFADQRFRAAVGVPVRWGDRFLGVLSIVAEEPGVYSASDAALLGLFATQAAIAIQNVRLYEETLQRNRELALLNRIIAASAASQEVDTILETACCELARVFDLPRAAAVEFDRTKTKARVVAEYRGEDRPALLGQTVQLAGVPLARQLMRHRAPLLVEDAAADPRLVLVEDAAADPRLGSVRDLLGTDETIQLLVLPLAGGDELVGSLGLARDGHAALEASQHHDGPIALLLTDVVMPQMSGPTLAEQLQAQRSELRVLYMSGYAPDAMAHRGVLDEGAALLSKPFTMERLTRLVRAVLDGGHSERSGR
jgi:GAF domain-containing protein